MMRSLNVTAIARALKEARGNHFLSDDDNVVHRAQHFKCLDQIRPGVSDKALIEAFSWVRPNFVNIMLLWHSRCPLLQKYLARADLRMTPSKPTDKIRIMNPEFLDESDRLIEFLKDSGLDRTTPLEKPDLSKWIGHEFENAFQISTIAIDHAQRRRIFRDLLMDNLIPPRLDLTRIETTDIDLSI